MERLKDRGYHGHGLLEITSEEMVGRYNGALESMGLVPTSLSQFSVDMIGWSPEIAKEKKNLYYLTRSLANPMAIIVNINQQHAPIYNRYHSFDRVMLLELFDRYSKQIMDINTTDALCIDLDNGVSKYTGIDDLLLVDSYVMRLETPGGLLSGARRQKGLVDGFLSSDTLWENKEAREELIRSGQRYGDLRNRHIIIPALTYRDTQIYYTEALGGVYILKCPSGGTATEILVIYKDLEQLNISTTSRRQVRLEPIDGENLIGKLTGAKYLQFDLQRYRANPAQLEEKKEILLADYICSSGLSYENWSELKVKNFITEYAHDIPELYFELERLQKQLVSGDIINMASLSSSLLACLTTPHERISPQYHHVLESLISEIDPGDPFRLFKYNKNRFYREYQNYSEPKKNWIVDYLNRRL